MKTTMTSDRKQKDADGKDTPPFSSPITVEEIQESEALEFLIRQETKRHLEVAWNSQRRLAQACFTSTVPEGDRSEQSKADKE